MFSIIFNFSRRLNFLILNSSFDASDLLINSQDHFKITGVLARVYLAPLPELCIVSLLLISVVIPVYKVPSEHSTI